MSVDKFRFVSPGIFTAEIDDSRLPAIPAAVGPVVIGRTQYGPSMRPVRVSSVQELERVFGAPHNGRGGGSGDPWRDGLKGAPTYATYAAKAFLRNSNPVTVVRVLGKENNNATTAGKAGWKITDSHVSSNPSTAAGAYGLFVAGWDGTNGASPITSGFALAAMLYTTGSEVCLKGATINGTSRTAAGVIIAGGGASKNQFTTVISGSTSETISFDLSSTSANFIRAKLNTDPTKINSLVTSTDSLKKYFLGETYERFALDTAGSGSLVAFVAKLDGGADFRFGNQEAKSGWVFSQHLADTGSFSFSETSGFTNVQKLFRFDSLYGGEFEHANLKISIENIRAATNPTENPFPTFDVVVRNLLETSNANAVERYNGVDLNPQSSNYIAKVIGDVYTSWDYTEKRYRELGTYANVSPSIRVEVSDAVENGQGNGLLPFGFYGAPRLASLTLAKNGSSSGASSALFKASGSLATYSGSVGDSGSVVFGTTQSSITMSFPSVALQSSNGSTDIRRFRWGLRATRGTDTNLVDINRAKFSSVNVYEPTGSTIYSTAFSLDDVVYSSTGSAWGLGNRVSGASLSAVSGTTAVLDYFNKFDLPLFGGFDGNNVLEKEPIINNRILGATGANESTNYAYNTIQVALDSVSDPEVVEMNVLTIPGLREPVLTDKVIEVCEQRGDALAIIDIEEDYVPLYEASSPSQSEADRKPNPALAVSSMKTRQKNSSYGCAFYPAVYVGSEGIFMPASIAALGTFGGTERSTAVWFAPAGFNRGGLNELNSGIGVSRTAQHLSSRERDELYAVNVNPIATFPAEGVVVFGQKTLQATPSALDRINVRRLMIFVKKEISRFATQVLFDPNVEVTWERFKSLCNPFLDGVRTGFGLTDFRVVLDETTTTPELVDRNILYAKILLKPTRAIEFIALDFVIKNTGASFDD